MSSTKGNTFYAKAAKGYIPKTTFDALATSMSRITLRLTKKGIFIREADCEDIRWAHILWDVSWPRKRFALYRCVKEAVVTLNAKHLQKMLRNVKKKDSLTFFIRKSDETKLGIAIQPSGAQSDGPAARSETVFLSIQHVESYLPNLPEVYEDEDKIERPVYGFPMVIGATDFQKIKKMSGSVNTLIVKIQKSNYIAFHAGDSNVMSSHLTFGELTTKPEAELEDDELESSDSSEKKPEETEESEENYSNDEESEESEENEEEFSEDEETDDDEEYPDIYEKEFTMSLFVPLVKLPGLTTQMEFYAPKMDAFPLKISMNATSGLGDITVFVKDQKQIALDEEKKILEYGSSTNKKK